MNNLFFNMVVALAALASVTAIETIVLGEAENYAILSKTGISTVPDSVITGDIAVSPITGAAMTGFSMTMDSDGTKGTSAQVTGAAFASNYLGDTKALLTSAVGDMLTAYADAAGRENGIIDLGAGILGGGDPLTTGVYTFNSDVVVGSELTFNGLKTDIFIIQVAGNLDINVNIILSGGALAKNIFWQVAGAVTVPAGVHAEGIILCKTGVTFQTKSSLNGRILAQTAAVLQKATISQPA